MYTYTYTYIYIYVYIRICLSYPTEYGYHLNGATYILKVQQAMIQSLLSIMESTPPAMQMITIAKRRPPISLNPKGMTLEDAIEDETEVQVDEEGGRYIESKSVESDIGSRAISDEDASLSNDKYLWRYLCCLDVLIA